MAGHLVTITSEQENDFLASTFGKFRTWTAGSDEAEPGVWRWLAGPESGNIFYRSGGTLTTFHNWGTKPSSGDGEAGHCMSWNASSDGKWSVESADVVHHGGVIVEFSPE